MTKPQFSAEPSMEDILASIRKMISEERMGPRPIPDQIGRSPFGESVAEPLTADRQNPGPRLERPETPAERLAPSFSSLSDALKAATPATDRRRTLEEKIADMLDSREVAPNSPTPPDSLAVFGANRPSLAPPADPTPFGVIPHRPEPEPQADKSQLQSRSLDRPVDEELQRGARQSPRLPEPPLNGAARRGDEGTSRPPVAPTLPTLRAGAPSGLAEPKREDAQRIIAMPHRNGSASAGAGALSGNGTNGASRGLRPLPGGAPAQQPSTALHGGDGLQDKKPEADKGGRSNAVTAKSADSGKLTPGDLGARSKPSDVTAKLEKEQRTRRTETGDGMAKPSIGARPEPGSAKAAPPRAAGADKPAGSGTPSDALLDAVVDMVHKEPGTLSVFTSGSSFINGVGAHVPASNPAPNMGQKLDRSAAELLRPMLRQWLADNMPRIVEEALRSELMSSEPASPAESKDKKES